MGNVGDVDGDVLLIFGEPDISRGGEDPRPSVEIDDVTEEEVLIMLAW